MNSRRDTAIDASKAIQQHLLISFRARRSLPFDFVKTRIQKMEKGPDGTYPYKGPVDCAIQTFKKEGPLKFYTGFPTYCIRCDPPPCMGSHALTVVWLRMTLTDRMGCNAV